MNEWPIDRKCAPRNRQGFQQIRYSRAWLDRKEQPRYRTEWNRRLEKEYFQSLELFRVRPVLLIRQPQSGSRLSAGSAERRGFLRDSLAFGFLHWICGVAY